MDRKKRLLDGLMGWIAEQARIPRESSVSALDEAKLFEQQEAVIAASTRAVSLLGGAGARATQQRSALDGVREYLHRQSERLRELRAGVLPVKDALDRIKLIAFNAGLEGARLGEPTGTPLLLVAEEVRALVERGLEGAEAYAAHIAQLEAERDEALAELDQARSHAGAIANELLSAQSAQRQLSDEITSLGKQLERVTGTDPELAKSVTDAARHAEGLLAALAKLSSRAPGSTALEPLVPLISELKGVLRGLSRARGGGQ